MEKKEKVKTATEVNIKWGNGYLVCDKCGEKPKGVKRPSGFIEFPPCDCGGKWTIKPSKLVDK